MSDTVSIPDWKRVYREGFLPLTSTPALKALQRALEEDDPRLIHGQTTQPLPLQYNLNCSCEAGCLVSYGWWKGEGLETVGEIEEAFAHTCHEADQRTDGKFNCGTVLNRWDEAEEHPERRATIRAEFLEEINLALAQREATP